MELDPEFVAETRAWLTKAHDDLRAAEFETTATPPLSSDVVFHAQQAVEKSFKALVVWHRRTFRKTHSLEELGEQCLSVPPSLRPLVDSAVPLTEYA
jgi:HEPN domain-containing protein